MISHRREDTRRESVLPDTERRVEENTAPEINERNRKRTEETVRDLSAQGQDAITARLEALDREWDIERVLETNASTLMLAGLALGVAVNRRFLLLPAVVGGFLLQHALQGWCPPVPVIRRLGYRTVREINEERQALKVARGDFQDLKMKHRGSAATAQRILHAVDR